MVLVTFDYLEPFIGQLSAIETWHFGSMKSSVLEIKSKKLIYTFVALVAPHRDRFYYKMPSRRAVDRRLLLADACLNVR